MKYLLSFTAILLSCLSVFGQAGLRRTPLTTNSVMNLPADGTSPLWNNAAGAWSNTVIGATVTNLPPYLTTDTLTNLAGTGLSPAATNMIPVGSGLKAAIEAAAMTNVTHILGAGTYTVTPSMTLSNWANGNTYIGITLRNPRNLTIIGIPGQTIIDGSAALGETFLITNGFNVMFYGCTFRGMTNHNVMALPGYPGSGANAYMFGGVGYFKCENLTFDTCRWERQADHGVIDWGTVEIGFASPCSTNGIQFLNCSGYDVGSYRTNLAGGISQDGSVIVFASGIVDNLRVDNCLSGVEPFAWVDDGPIFGAVVRNSTFTRVAVHAIGNVGATNIHGMAIYNNYINNPSGFTSYHTNSWTSGNPLPTKALFLNGGADHQIFGNEISGNMYNGIFISSGAAGMDDCKIFNNHLHDIGGLDGLGNSIEIGDFTDSAAVANVPRRLSVSRNHIERNVGTAIIMHSGRDSLLEENYINQPTAYTSQDVNLTGIKIGVGGNVNNLLTNIIVRNNYANAGEVASALGYVFESSLASGTIYNNTAVGFYATATQGITNRSTVVMDDRRFTRLSVISNAYLSSLVVTNNQTNFSDVSIENSANLRLVNNPVNEFTVYGEGNITSFDPVGLFSFTVEKQLNVNTNLQVAGTNLVNWLRMTGGIASNSFLYLNAQSNVVGGTFGSGLTFSAGTLTSSGGAGSTNNPVQAIGTAILTNGTIYKPLDVGDNTNIVLSFNTNYYVYSPSNNFGITLSDVPPSTDGRQIFLKLINTNSTSGVFPASGLNGGSVILLAALSTNEYTINKDTNGLWIRSGQMFDTGTGDTNVFNISPNLHTPTNWNPTIADAGGAKITFDFGASFTDGDSLVAHGTGGIITNKAVSGSASTNLVALAVGQLDATNAPIIRTGATLQKAIGMDYALSMTNATGQTEWNQFIPSLSRAHRSWFLPTSTTIGSSGHGEFWAVVSSFGILEPTTTLSLAATINTPATAGSSNAISGNGFRYWHTGRGRGLVWQGGHYVQNTNLMRVWMGLTSATAAQLGAADQTAHRYAAFRYSCTNEGTYRFVTSNGSTFTTNDTGVAVVQGTHRDFRIIEDVSGAAWYGVIDGVTVATNTTDLPSGGMQSMFHVSTWDATPKTNYLTYIEARGFR